MKILVIEDEARLADSLKTLLSGRGFTVDTAADGPTGLEYARLGVHDLVILDVMLPGLDGCRLVRQLRREHNPVPVLMLTARSQLQDRVEGLDSGADYYLTKPFDTRELLACVNALLRRQGNQVEVMILGNTELELSSALLRCGSNVLQLSAREFDVLRLLMQSGSRNVSKQTILARVWGLESNAVENHVEVYVGFLRKKLASLGSNIRIESVRRLGYHLEVAE